MSSVESDKMISKIEATTFYMIKNLDLNNLKLDEKSYKNIIYYIGYVRPNSVKNLYIIVNNVKGYDEEHNEKKFVFFFFLTLVHTD